MGCPLKCSRVHVMRARELCKKLRGSCVCLMKKYWELGTVKIWNLLCYQNRCWYRAPVVRGHCSQTLVVFLCPLGRCPRVAPSRPGGARAMPRLLLSSDDCCLKHRLRLFQVTVSYSGCRFWLHQQTHFELFLNIPNYSLRNLCYSLSD